MKGLWAVACLIALGPWTTRGVADSASRSGDEADPAATTEGRTGRAKPSLAERYEAIKVEYDARNQALWAAMEKVETRAEQNKLFREMSPDTAAYCRRMIDVAQTDPKNPAAREALLWVIDHPNRADHGSYGVEFARAAALLVFDHGDDPEAVRIGLGLDPVMTIHRDALLLGFYAAAKGREAKGLARLALAQYLERKAAFAEGARKVPGRPKIRLDGVVDDDGKVTTKEIEASDEEYSYSLLLRQCDTAMIRAEAERLYAEVIAEYSDIPHITVRQRKLEALLKRPEPTWNGRPLTEDQRRQVEARLARTSTLGQVAEARLDDWHNLAVGKPAPQIEGVDFEGKPLRLSDHRGKVVVLVFWGSWCGPCMREVPHERQLSERYKGRPFTLLGVNCREPKEVARKTMEAQGMTWPNWHDGEEDEGPIAGRYHIRGFPTIYVIDAEGKIRSKKAQGSSLDDLVETLVTEAENKAARG